MMQEHHGLAKATVAELLHYTSAIADARERDSMELPEEVARLSG